MLGVYKHVLNQGNSLVIHSHTLMPSFTHSHTLFSQFSPFTLFWLILGQIQCTGCLNACNGTVKPICDTFTHSHALLHTLSQTLHTLFTHFGLIFPISVQIQLVRCLKACTLYLELILILSCTLGNSHGDSIEPS